MRIKDFTDTIRHLTDPFNIPEARRMIEENPALSRQQFAEGQLVQPGPGRPGYGGTKTGAAKIVRIKEERKKKKIAESIKYLDKLSHPDAKANIERWGRNQGLTIDETWKAYRKLDIKNQSTVRVGAAPSYKKIPPEIFKKLKKQFSKMSHEEFAKKLNEMGYKASAKSSFTVKKVKERMSNLGIRMDPATYDPYILENVPSDDPKRLKKIDDYVKEFEKDYGRKPTAKHIRTALNEQRRVMPFYEAKYGELSAQRVTNVQAEVVRILKDPKIIENLNAGKFPTITDIRRITKLDPVLAESRLVDLAERLRENPKYKKLANDYLNQPGAINPESFGGRKRGRSRMILENRFTKLMGLDQKLPSLRSEIIRKIQSFIPELKSKTRRGILAVDEIAGLTSSMRRGSGPYAIFGQILGSDFNTLVKGHGIDKAKGFMEKKLVTLDKNDPKRIKLQKRYNNAINEFELKANKNNPAKKVRGLKLSFKPPSETVKNKKVYNQYKDLFDTHYEKHGYSFEVPADRDSLTDISKKLDNKSFQNIVKNRLLKLVGKGGKVGALVGLGTLTGAGFALAGEEDMEKKEVTESSMVPKIIKENPYTSAAVGTGAALTQKPVRSLLGKTFRTLGTPLAGPAFAAWNVSDKMKEGESLADAIIDPLTGAELALPGMFKENLAKITKDPRLMKLLSLGYKIPKTAMTVGRLTSPVGWGIAGLGALQDSYKDYQRRKEFLTPERKRRAQREYFDKDEPMFAEGGITSLKK